MADADFMGNPVRPRSCCGETLAYGSTVRCAAETVESILSDLDASLIRLPLPRWKAAIRVKGIEPKRERPVTFVSAGLPRHDPQTLTAMAGLLESALSLVD